MSGQLMLGGEAGRSDVVVGALRFGEVELKAINFKGRTAWVGKDVGLALGYGEEGRSFVRQITDEWSDELIEGTDFVKLTGKDLRDFKRLAEVGGISLPSAAPVVVLLYESGINICCLKTEKPTGKLLRRRLADEVLPQIRRTGAFVPRMATRTPSATALRLEERKFQALSDIYDKIEAAGYIRPDVLLAHRIQTTAVFTGQDLHGLLPPVEDDWKTPEQIGELLGVTSNRIGRVISELKIRGNFDGIARAQLNKARHAERTVTSYEYSPKAVEMIRAKLIEQGHIAADKAAA